MCPLPISFICITRNPVLTIVIGSLADPLTEIIVIALDNGWNLYTLVRNVWTFPGATEDIKSRKMEELCLGMLFVFESFLIPLLYLIIYVRCGLGPPAPLGIRVRGEPLAPLAYVRGAACTVRE